MGLRNIAVTITGDGTSLSQALRRAAGEIDQLGKDTQGSNEKTRLSWAQVGAAAVAAGALAATGLISAGTAAAEFETRMRNVNSIVQGSEAEFRNLGASVLDISRSLPQDANTLAEGLYEISSSGFAGAEGLLVLSKAAEAATAGLASTDTSARAITAVLNAYGLTAASAGDVSDTLFQTVNLGVVSFEELSGVLGDVVGTAAAAGVNIAEVGAAIATMTLSGISGSEAATSLNRLLEASINPSEALAGVYQRLGYESGAAALENKGLHGVLEDVRKATGGNITTLLALFPEIRAARGALALMSDEGRTYARVSAAIEDENVRLGATQRALNQQLQAAGAQFTIYKNGARATAIEVGTRVLPAFVRFLEVTGALGAEAVPLLQRGITAVTPLLRTLYDTGEDVVSILGTLYDAASPAAAALLAIGGSVIIAGLQTYYETIAAATGFLAEHQEVVIALAAAYGASLAPSIIAATAAFGRFALTTVILNLYALIVVAGGATASLGALAAAMLSVQAVATLGLGVVLFAAANAFRVYGKAGEDASKQIAESTKDFDALDTTRAQQQIAALREETLRSLAVGRDYEGFLGTLRAGSALLPFDLGDDRALKASALAKEGLARMRELEVQAANAASNLDDLTSSTGLSREAIVKLAGAQKIDLTGSFEASADARKQFLQYLADTEKQSGLTGRALADAGILDLEAVEKLNEALSELKDKAASAFAGTSNILGSFDPKAGAAEVESATGRVKDAEQALADLRAKQAEKQNADVGDSIDLRKAEQRLAAARADGPDKVAAAEQNLADVRARANEKDKIGVAGATDLRKAQEALAEAQSAAQRARQERDSQTLEGSYKRAIAAASQFSADLATATARGLDAGAVVKLLQQGPEQAGPILEQLVADSSGRLIEMVNNGERALQDINQRVVEQARLTALAVNSTTDELSRDLGLAMQISSEVIAQGAAATVESVAARIGAPSEQVLQTAAAFGITLGTAAQQGLGATNLTVPAPVAGEAGLERAREEGRLLNERVQAGLLSAPLRLPDVSSQDIKVNGGTLIAGAATGGLLTGPGTGTSDNLLIRASNREFVQRRAAVDYYGVDFMHQLNRLQIPRFATGGQIGGSSPIVRVEGGTRHSNATTHQYDQVVVQGVSMDDALRTLERKKRTSGWSGGARR